MPRIPLRRLDPSLPLPSRRRDTDAAYDLHSRLDVVVDAGGRAEIPTGIAVSLPVGVAGLVLPRSGLARDFGLSLVNSPGLIDPGYVGEIVLLAIVHGPDPLSIAAGERCGQLLLVPSVSATWDVVDELERSERGEEGFGSSGR